MIMKNFMKTNIGFFNQFSSRSRKIYPIMNTLLHSDRLELITICNLDEQKFMNISIVSVSFVALKFCSACKYRFSFL